MEKTTIVQNINNWTEARAGKNSEVFRRLFDNIVGFSFTALSGDDLTDIYYHAYAAIDNGLLTFYLIRSDYDTAAEYDESHIIPVQLISSTNMEPIPKGEAGKRRDAWVKNCNVWLDNQVASEDGMYQIFVIPANDISFGQISAYFALSTGDHQLLSEYTADLILYSPSDTGPAGQPAYDLVRPVPPFKPKPGISKEAFYLLSLIKEQAE